MANISSAIGFMGVLLQGFRCSCCHGEGMLAPVTADGLRLILAVVRQGNLEACKCKMRMWQCRKCNCAGNPGPLMAAV